MVSMVIILLKHYKKDYKFNNTKDKELQVDELIERVVV